MQDITQELRDSARKLKNGELAMSPGFTLYQSISAFELGNPKMDTGMNFSPFEQDLEKYHVKVNTAEKLSNAIDCLMRREMAWHSGATLIQTIFSGLFVEQVLNTLRALRNRDRNAISTYMKSLLPPRSWEDVCTIYVLALLKTCSIVIQLMEADETGVVAIEEDFHTSTFDWYVLQDEPVDLIQQLIDSAIKFCRQNNEQALVDRLSLRSAWLHAIRTGVSRRQGNIKKTLELLDAISESPDAGCDNFFTVTVQTRADQCCLARPLVSMTFDEALKILKGMVETILGSCRIFNIDKSADLLGFFLQFSSCNHLPLPRILIKNLIHSTDLLGLSNKQWVLKDIKELSFPSLDVKAVQKRCNVPYEAFMIQAVACYWDLLISFCLNRCKQRQGLISAVSAFDSLHVAGQQLDRAMVEQGLAGSMSDPNTKQHVWALEFSTWAYQRKLQMMVWVTLMAFEEQLIQPWEMGALYWYSRRLCSELVGQLSRLKLHFEQDMKRTTEEGYPYLVAMEVEARCLEQMCYAYAFVFQVLRVRKLIKERNSKWGSPDLIFGLRLECFESVGLPQVPSYQEYEKFTTRFDDDFALKAAKSSLSSARSMVETLARATGGNPELDMLKRSCFGLGLLVTKLGVTTSGTVKITYEGYHKYFPVPVLV